MVDDELHAVDAALRSVRSYRFTAQSVAYMESPERLATKIETEGWTPVDVRLRITDVASVIERFGGRQLYGDNPSVPVRELIGNAADAIRARVALSEGAFSHGQITVRFGSSSSMLWIEVEDNGIGMSEAVLKGPLLDFGTSYWRSSLSQKEHPGLLSSKFEPTGRFGIGFFSVFMLGRRVRVVTRPYRGGEQDTRVLEVSMETNVRPYIRRPAPGEKSERMLDGGTRVRVYLDHEPWSKGGLFGSNATNKNTQLEMLSLLVGRIAPALDVSIYCSAADENHEPTLVVRANDWEEIPFEQLVARVTGERADAFRHVGAPLNIRSSDQLIGRIQLTGASLLAGKGVLTVRGLSTFEAQRTFHGLLLADRPDLSRSHARPLATVDELRAAMVRGLPSFGEKGPSYWDHDLWLSQFLLNLGLLPEMFQPFILNGKRASISMTRKWLKTISPGESIRILLHQHLNLEGQFEDFGEQVQIEDYLSTWRQPKDLIVAPTPDNFAFIDSVEITPDLPPQNMDYLGFNRTKTGELFPCSLAAWVIAVASDCWNTDLKDLTYHHDDEFESSVGSLKGRVPVYARHIVLNRPKHSPSQTKSTARHAQRTRPRRLQRK
jgi:hypothetical protein